MLILINNVQSNVVAVKKTICIKFKTIIGLKDYDNKIFSNFFKNIVKIKKH